MNHGVSESAEDHRNEDQDICSALIGDLHTNTTIKNITRIGKLVYGKYRPLNIKLMGNMPALQGVSITDNLTMDERPKIAL